MVFARLQAPLIFQGNSGNVAFRGRVQAPSTGCNGAAKNLDYFLSLASDSPCPTPVSGWRHERYKTHYPRRNCWLFLFRPPRPDRAARASCGRCAPVRRRANAAPAAKEFEFIVAKRRSRTRAAASAVGAVSAVRRTRSRRRTASSRLGSRSQVRFPASGCGRRRALWEQWT